jgi:multimeric flavodoxin WrbA
MKVLILEASPNKKGLTASCAEAAAEGISAAGAQVEWVRLNDVDLAMCEACGTGWGICRTEHHCTQEDCFNALHGRVISSDALVIVTPVYWGEPAEVAKAFLDRLRRCEASKGDASGLAGKWVLVVAAAGGTGGGAISCLTSLERFIHQVRAKPFDLIGVMQRSRAYTVPAIRAAAEAMVRSR